MKDIKRMKLYHYPERVYNEIAYRGGDDAEKLDVQELCSFDQYHYWGTEVLDEVIKIFRINSRDKILDIGSGIGGPARYLAYKTGCQVTALELQEDLHQVALDLTTKCGLSKLVEHVNGDILQFSDRHDYYDYVISLLCFLHIPDRSSLLGKCQDILKPHGKMFIEDFYKLQELNEEERRVLSRDVSCDYLPTIQEYKKQLTNSGFIDIKMIDKTESWINFVNERMKDFSQHRSNHVDKHDLDVVEGLEDFYKKMAGLYNGGNLGGLRIIAKNG